jgi:hypothetical protein
LTGNISDLQNMVSSHTGTLSTQVQLINTKQNQITLTNPLNFNLIADGTISNLQFQTLFGIDTTRSIQAQFNNENDSITLLNTLQISDVSDIQMLTTFRNSQIEKTQSIDTSINLIDNGISVLNDLQYVDISNKY